MPREGRTITNAGRIQEKLVWGRVGESKLRSCVCDLESHVQKAEMVLGLGLRNEVGSIGSHPEHANDQRPF